MFKKISFFHSHLFLSLIFVSVVLFSFSSSSNALSLSSKKKQVYLQLENIESVETLRIYNGNNSSFAQELLPDTQVPWNICDHTICERGNKKVTVEFLDVNRNVLKKQIISIFYDIPEKIILKTTEKQVEVSLPEPIITKEEVIEKKQQILKKTDPQIIGIQEIEKVGNIAAIIGVVAGSLATVSVLAGGTFSGIALVPARIGYWLLIIFGLKRRYNPWGTVYDSHTKQPLDPVLVELLDFDGKVISSAITDLDGRFGFLIDPGLYTIRVQKTHYLFSTKASQLELVYDNVYRGEVFEVKDTSDVVIYNIPMDNIHIDWNQEEKKRIRRGFLSLGNLSGLVMQEIFLYIGAIMTIFLLMHKITLFNIFMGIGYLFLIAVRFFGLRPKAYGYILLPNKKPLCGGIIEFSLPKIPIIVSKTKINEEGKYRILIAKGTYDVNIYDINESVDSEIPEKILIKKIENVTVSQGFFAKTLYM
jgi:hypothetical protein